MLALTPGVQRTFGILRPRSVLMFSSAPHDHVQLTTTALAACNNRLGGALSEIANCKWLCVTAAGPVAMARARGPADRGLDSWADQLQKSPALQRGQHVRVLLVGLRTQDGREPVAIAARSHFQKHPRSQAPRPL